MELTMSIRNKKELITDQMSITLANALSDHNKPPFELSKIAKDFLVDYYLKFDKTFYEARYDHSYYNFVFYMWNHLNLETQEVEKRKQLGKGYRVEYEPWWIDKYY